jgi:hypothetical protein
MAMVTIYREMRAHQPEGYLPLHLDDDDARAQAEELQEQVRVEGEVDLMASELAEWLDMKILPNGQVNEDFEEEAPVRSRRTRVCMGQVKAFMDMPKNVSNAWLRSMGKALRKEGWEPKGVEKMPGFGRTKVYKPGKAVTGRWYIEDKADRDKSDHYDLV